MALESVDPTGSRRDDLRAYATSIIASGNAKEIPGPFYPYFGETFDEMSENDDILSELESLGYFVEEDEPCSN